MSANGCCNVASTVTGRRAPAARTTDGKPQPRTFLRRCLDIAEWMVPGAVLALIPKCPLCLLAYLGIAGGMGLSMSMWMQVRTAVVILCAASLLYLAARSAHRMGRAKAVDRTESKIY